MVSAGVTYYVLLAIFPAIAAAVSIYGIFLDPRTIAEDVSALAHVLPGGAISIVREEILRIAAKSGSTLGLTALVSIAISLFSARGGVSSLFTALNDVARTKESRRFVPYTLLTLIFTLGALLLMFLGAAVIFAMPLFLRSMGPNNPLTVLIDFVRWPLLWITVAIGVGVLFRYGPSPSVRRTAWFSWGSTTATCLWLAASLLFSWYAANYGTFDKTYGSLGAIFGFMTWIWISVMAVLIGAEVNEVMRGA